MAELNPDHVAIMADLDQLDALEIFDLSGELGSSLISAARAGIADHFDAEVDPDGVPWPELSSDYARAKARLFPGANILVAKGTLRAGIFGQPTTAPDSAVYTFGTNETDRQEAAWATEGDPLGNRPPRPFVDLNAESISESDQILDHQFDERMPQ